MKKPFKKGDVVDAEIVCPGRYEHEQIAVAKGRCIIVMGPKDKGRVKLKLVRDKHNVFKGAVLK